MKMIFKRIRDFLVKALEYTVIFSMGILVLDVAWQVFTRFVLNNPSSWTEELATMLLIWASLLGASVTLLRKGHLGVDYFIGKLKEKHRTIVEIAVYLFVGFFVTSVMIIGGLQLVYITLTFKQLSPALNMKMGYVYLALPISGLFMLLFSIETIIEKIKILTKRGEQI